MRLYKLNENGALQYWEASPDGPSVRTVWGQVGGAEQATTEAIKGVNQGRANATTPEQQARAEATRRTVAKLKDGYCRTEAAARARHTDPVIQGGVSPMLAHIYAKQAHKIRWPAYAQPKLDGHRCIAVIEAGKATLWSRTRKPITSAPHVVAALEALCADIGDTTFDGELYNHKYRKNFEALTSLIRSGTPSPLSTELEYHIYDIVTADPFETRTMRIDAMDLAAPLIDVDTAKVESPEELAELAAEWVALGYEGAMVRNAAGLYVHKRSYDLLKVKRFDDTEYECIGVEEGVGKLAGHAIFVMSHPGGGDFTAKLIGPLPRLATYWADPSLVLGKMVTIQHQGITEYGIPRFPVALRIREDV